MQYSFIYSCAVLLTLLWFLSGRLFLFSKMRFLSLLRVEWLWFLVNTNFRFLNMTSSPLLPLSSLLLPRHVPPPPSPALRARVCACVCARVCVRVRTTRDMVVISGDDTFYSALIRYSTQQIKKETCFTKSCFTGAELAVGTRPGAHARSA